MSADIAIGALGAGSMIGGGIGAPIARLCGRQNLLRQHRWEFSIDPNEWLPAGAGGRVAQVTPLYDPTAIMARNVLGIRDGATTAGLYVRGKCDNGASVLGTSWVFSCWVKALGADLANSNIRIRDLTSSESIGNGDGSPGPLTAEEWVFFSRTWTWATSTQSVFYVDVFPEYSPGTATGTIAISNPRCHRLLSNVSDLPDWPLRDWSFEPWVRTRPVRDRFGTIEVSRRGWVPVIRSEHPAVDKSQHEAISSVYAHDGLVFFEPNADGPVAFWMTTGADEMEYRLVGDRALGYEGRMNLVGVDPIYGIPDATLYIEEEHVVYRGIPRFVRAV